MGCMWCIPPLLAVTVVLADYTIDNANTTVVYSMSASQSGETWQTYSLDTQPLTLPISNSTGDYTIVLDPSRRFDQNYALGECGTADNCFVEIPFIGSGIAIYVFNAGLGGMLANFSVDGDTAVSAAIGPPPPPNYQVSQAKIYHRRGLPTGNHTIRMTMMDWNGTKTSMKFDYAHVNETFVATPTHTVTPTNSTSISSQTPTASGSSTASNNISHGDIKVGAALGGLALLVSLILIGFFYLRKRKATSQDISLPDPNTYISPFTSELNSLTLAAAPHAHKSPFSPQRREEITGLTTPAILRDGPSVSQHPTPVPDHTSQSIKSGQSSRSPQPLRTSLPQGEDNHTHTFPNGSRVADAASYFLDPQFASRYNLNVEQIDVINRLRRDSVPMETVARIMEGFLSSNAAVDGVNDRTMTREMSMLSEEPPPSYRPREHDD